jgi:hypothetical protein
LTVVLTLLVGVLCGVAVGYVLALDGRSRPRPPLGDTAWCTCCGVVPGTAGDGCAHHPRVRLRKHRPSPSCAGWHIGPCQGPEHIPIMRVGPRN